MNGYVVSGLAFLIVVAWSLHERHIHASLEEVLFCPMFRIIFFIGGIFFFGGIVSVFV